MVKDFIRIAKNQIYDTCIHDFTCSYSQSCVVTLNGLFYVAGCPWKLSNNDSNISGNSGKDNMNTLSINTSDGAIYQDGCFYEFTPIISSRRLNSVAIGNDFAILYHR